MSEFELQQVVRAVAIQQPVCTLALPHTHTLTCIARTTNIFYVRSTAVVNVLSAFGHLYCPQNVRIEFLFDTSRLGEWRRVRSYERYTHILR